LKKFRLAFLVAIVSLVVCNRIALVQAHVYRMGDCEKVPNQGYYTFSDGNVTVSTVVSTLRTTKATIWYLDHSGFAVKTRNHFVVFDYSNDRPTRVDKKGLAAGIVDPNEIKDENMLVFVSHEHADHFNPVISSWRNIVRSIKYIVPPIVCRTHPAFAAEIGDRLVEISPGSELSREDFSVFTIVATDSGVGFLVKVDGITMFHAGDHALWGEGIEREYQNGIRRVVAALSGTKLDLAFLPLGPRSPNKAIVREGALWATKELAPKVVFPMHSFGDYTEGETFAKLVQDQTSSQAVSMKERGTSFSYGDEVTVTSTIWITTSAATSSRTVTPSTYTTATTTLTSTSATSTFPWEIIVIIFVVAAAAMIALRRRGKHSKT